MNISPDVTGPRMKRTVNWNTWKKPRWFIFDSNDQKALPYWSRYIILTDAGGHESQLATRKATGIHLRQGNSSLKTASAVVALGQKTGTQPTTLNFTAFDPLLRKPIQQKSKQMPWLVVVSANDDCRAGTTQSLSNLGTGSYSGQHRVREFFQKSTGVSLELSSITNYQSYWELPTPASQIKTFHRLLEEISSDLPAHILPTAPQDAMKILA